MLIWETQFLFVNLIMRVSSYCSNLEHCNIVSVFLFFFVIFTLTFDIIAFLSTG